MNLFTFFHPLSLADKLTITREHLTIEIERAEEALASNQRRIALCQRELLAVDKALESLGVAKGDHMPVRPPITDAAGAFLSTKSHERG